MHLKSQILKMKPVLFILFITVVIFLFTHASTEGLTSIQLLFFPLFILPKQLSAIFLYIIIL